MFERFGAGATPHDSPGEAAGKGKQFRSVMFVFSTSFSMHSAGVLSENPAIQPTGVDSNQSSQAPLMPSDASDGSEGVDSSRSSFRVPRESVLA